MNETQRRELEHIAKVPTGIPWWGWPLPDSWRQLQREGFIAAVYGDWHGKWLLLAKVLPAGRAALDAEPEA